MATEEPLPTRPRRCLRCDQLFPSTGPANRICPPCTALNSRVSIRNLDIRPTNFEDEDNNYGQYFVPRK